MKKSILSVIMALILCMAFVSCSDSGGSQSGIYNELESGGKGASGDSKNDKKKGNPPIYEAFKKSIGEFNGDGTQDVKYSLVHIDSDNTPELLYNTAEGKYELYAYNATSKEIVRCGSFKTKSGPFVYDGMLLATSEGTDYTVYVKISLDQNFKINSKVEPYITCKSVTAGSTEKEYIVNNVAVTEAEYNLLCAEMSVPQFHSCSDLSYIKDLKKMNI